MHEALRAWEGFVLAFFVDCFWTRARVMVLSRGLLLLRMRRGGRLFWDSDFALTSTNARPRNLHPKQRTPRGPLSLRQRNYHRRLFLHRHRYIDLEDMVHRRGMSE